MSVLTEQLTLEEQGRLSPFAQRYTEGMLQQLGSHKQDPVIGIDMFPTALLTDQERREHFKVTRYSEIRGNQELIEAAKNINVVIHNLDAGLGTSVKRDSYLQELAPHIDRGENPTIGSKSTDLYIPITFPNGANIYANVAELKLHRAIVESQKYKHMDLRPIVNDESRTPMESLYTLETLYSRAGLNAKQTYGEMIQQQGNMSIGDMLLQDALPTIDTASGQLTMRKRAPGGHGQAAAQVLYEIAEGQNKGEQTVRYIWNGDGWTNWIPEEAAAEAAQKSVFTVITTTALPCDVKGGKCSLKRHPNGAQTPYILEAGQTKKTGQQELFYQMGQQNVQLPAELADLHHPGEQYFNTNNVIISEEPLREFLQAIRSELGDQFMQYAIAPEFFPNQNGDVIQFDGAMGSLVTRLNEIVETDERVQAIWKRLSGGRDFLRFVNIEPEYRDEFFGPIKFPVDHAEKFLTDHFFFDTNRMMPVNTRPGHVVHWGGDFVQKNTFFADVLNTMRAIGTRAKIQELDEFTAYGKVLFADFIGVGKVIVDTRAFNGVVDLNSLENRVMLGFASDAPLVFMNQKIVISENGTILVEQLY